MDSIPAMYLYFQKKLKEKEDGDGLIRLTDAISTFRQHRLPKSIVILTIKEMEHQNLIKKEKRLFIRLANYKQCEKLDKMGELFHQVGVF